MRRIGARLAVAAAGAATLVAAPASAQSPARAQRAASPVQSAAPTGGVAQGLSTARPGVSQRVAAAIAQLRMGACSGRLQTIVDFLVEGQDGAFTVQPLGPDSNRWPVVVTLETAHPAQGRTRLDTIIVSPGPSCSGFYQQTIWWAEPCAELKRTTFAAFQNAKPLYREVQVSEANAGLQLYLTAVGSGCMSVKKELFH